ncbi:hypothetical protein M9458_012838, partial [Cirrhinus mrigala]
AVSAELPETIKTQNSGSSQTFPEAPGAYGSRSCGHAARLAPYKTASALATRPNPKIGTAARSGLALLRNTLHFYGQVHVVVNTDASMTGWDAVCNGQAASGSWTGPRLHWHLNCFELLAVFLALRRFLPMLRDKHVLVCTDNTATVAYINHQRGLRSHRISQLARHLLLWSQTRLFTFQQSSIVQPMRSHDSSHCLENGESIPRFCWLHLIDPPES